MLLIQSGDQIAGGGLPVITVPYATYIANKASYDSADVLLNVPDYPRKQIPSDYIGYDQNLDLENIGDIATKSLGKVEYKSDNKALYGHAEGEYFINKDGQYCRCTSTIQTGQTLTENTNYVVTDAGSVLKQINTDLSVKTYPSINSSGIRGVKYGKIVYLSFENVPSMTISANANITTLPSELRPTFEGLSFKDAIATNGRRIVISTNGNIFPTTAISNEVIRGFATYISN